MCGILGVAFSRNADLHQRLPLALDALAHRGPNGEGSWESEDVWLGHRRLAIIDLSARSDQPMVDEETGNVLVFNGEIYNYRELRAELEGVGVRFRTSSDTEVLLKAYRHWGAGAFERMNGMWAVAIWHPRERRLLLCRDRFGVKPLYYARLAGALAFASEPKALLALVPELAEPNPAAIAKLIVSSRSHAGEFTYFRGIRSVPPASWTMLQDSGQIEFRRFWSYPEAEPSPSRSLAQEQEEFDFLLESSVRLRMRSDVPVGLTLSGGLDSTAVLSVMAGEGSGQTKAFTARFSGYFDEFGWADTAARQAGVDLVPVDSASGDWIGTLREIVWHMDSPGFSSAVFPLWNIAARARELGVPVLLEGQGADELLGGYVQYAASHLWNRSLGGRPVSAARDFPGFCRTFGRAHLLKWMARLLVAGPYQAWQARMGRGSILTDHMREDSDFAPSHSMLDPYELMHADHSSAVLPSLLHYGDAISMAHGIESRLPFLDYRLVEWVFRERPSLFEGGRTKSPIRNFLATRGYMRHATRQDKQGFTTPVQAWMRENEEWVNDTLLGNPNALLWDYIKYGEGKPLLAPKKYSSAYHGYKMIAIQLWLEGLDDWRRGGVSSRR